jgi:monoamine oxidase
MYNTMRQSKQTKRKVSSRFTRRRYTVRNNHNKHSHSTVYDTIVVGGGIAGLYTAYSLLKRTPDMRLVILEKRGYLGGRVYTYHGDGAMVVEAGAGRFSNHHKRLRKLIRELHLDKHVREIGGGFSYVPSGPESSVSVASSYRLDKDIADVMAASTRATNLQNISFLDYAKSVIGQKRANHIVDSFGYYSELVLMNAYDAIRLMKILDTNTKTNTFYSLSGGLSQIIAGLEAAIRKFPHAEIRVKTEIVDIVDAEAHEESDNPVLYHCVLGDGSSILSNQCVLALPKPALKKLPMFRSLRKTLDSILCGSLCRIYSQFAPADAKWLRGLEKTTTNNDLRMIIPIDADKGIVMISYTDNRFADKWNNLYKRSGIDAVNRRIAKLIRQTFHIDIAEPIQTKVFYWSCGVGYWGVGVNSSEVAKQMIRPFPSKRIFVCGEHFSEGDQQWMEGALETSEHVVRAM